jgi:hypothetical protein
VLLSLSRLHNSDDNSINDVLSFNNDLSVVITTLLLFVFVHLVALCRHEIDSNVGILESSVDICLLSRSELGFLHVLLLEDLKLRVAEIDKSIIKLSFRDSAVLFDVSVGECVILIEETENNCLIAVGDKDVLPCGEGWLDFNGAVVI